MEGNILNISKDMLDNLSIEELAELKIELDELNEKLDNISEICNAM